ncbi:MAG TPA: hypothetical protein VGP44_01170 [Gemmatimonadales bacterium]|nr:hypothetical protein [Gemmatimonadales bacterium]
MTVLLVLLSFPMDAAAQKTPEGLVEVREGGRSGFWLGVGIGAGGESYGLQPGTDYSNVLYRSAAPSSSPSSTPSPPPAST